MLSGDLFIGGDRRPAAAGFVAQDPSLGAAIAEPRFAEATPADVADACAAAEAVKRLSVRVYRKRRSFLRMKRAKPRKHLYKTT